MNKEFVPYQESLELKKLGFDEPCFAAYSEDEDDSSLFIYWNDLVNMSELFISQDNCEKFDYECLASTFSQAFRWFREKYDMGHQITYAGVKGRYNAFTDDWVYDSNGELKEFSYEEAELACLRKLIQIVKEKL